MAAMLPRKPAVNGNLSLEIICRNWVFGPLRAKKEPMMNKQPSVKEMANFCGNSTITGRNMKKAINMKKTPAAVMMAKHMTACLDGTKLAAACTFPGNSLTPFVTELKAPTMVLLADLRSGARDSGTADSRSRPVEDGLAVAEATSEPPRVEEA